MRSAIAGLSTGLFGEVVPIKDFPKVPNLNGIGLSDWESYSRRLKKAIGYKNTFFDRRPRLDITRPGHLPKDAFDFLVSIDVFEHVPPPVKNAFLGAATLLRPGGVLIVSVPYGHDQQTIEHFPDLHEFVVTEILGSRCLVNRKKDGRLEIFDNLVFHGGRGQTLEMRRFCFREISGLLAETGFEQCSIVSHLPQWGVVYENNCSHTIIAKKKLKV